MANNNNKFNQWSLTLLRVVLGIMFTYHGFLKFFVPGGFRGTIDFLTYLKMPLPIYSALVISILEFFGGLLLIIGLITRWTAVLLILEMLVALFKVHIKQGYLISDKAYGYEYIALILTVLLVILINGAGKLSVGKRFFKSKHLH